MTAITGIKIGDSIEITDTMTGKVISKNSGSMAHLDNGRVVQLSTSIAGFKREVKVLEPEYEVGKFYLDGDGCVYKYLPSRPGKPWVRPWDEGRCYSFDDRHDIYSPRGTMRKLVPVA